MTSVSIIIPTYNRSWAIKKAIDSVLHQNFENYEIIVVDDGSTDDTRDVLSAYAHRITMIRQKNKGVSAARNKGIEASSGRLIAFLDSDDLWLKEKLSVQVDYFNNNPDALICQTEEIWIRNGIRVNPKMRHKKVSGNIFEPSLALCLVSPSAVMMRRQLLDEVGGFDETLPACEDYDLWLRVSCRFPVYLIDTPLIIKHGGHADQLSRVPGLDKYRIKALVKLINGNHLSQDQKNSAAEELQRKCVIYKTGCLKRGNDADAAYYSKLMRCDFV